jgi:hypothetical protein
MARTPAEHAKRIHRRLHALHTALADFAREHGAAVGLDDDTMQAAIVPKDPPPNPERQD